MVGVGAAAGAAAWLGLGESDADEPEAEPEAEPVLAEPVLAEPVLAEPVLAEPEPDVPDWEGVDGVAVVDVVGAAPTEVVVGATADAAIPVWLRVPFELPHPAIAAAPNRSPPATANVRIRVSAI